MNDDKKSILLEYREGPFVCPCGGTFKTAQIPVDEEDTEGMPVLLHTMPPCNEFSDKDLLSYLRWVNETNEAKQ